jgi:hypothetical protein
MARQCGNWSEQENGQEKRAHDKNLQAMKSGTKMTELLNELLAALAGRGWFLRRFMMGARLAWFFGYPCADFTRE